MTSYQNVSESEISGYNDCPVVEFNKSSNGGKSRRRVVSGHQFANSPSSSTASLASLSSSTSSSLTPPMGPRPGGSKRVPSSAAASEPTSVISKEAVQAKLDELFSLTSSLPERELTHYKNKLQDALSRGTIKQQWYSIVVESIDNYKDTDRVKNKLIQFMLHNDGTTSWGTPLRKLLENVQ
ncbi:unnamed protein product [Cyberlindnera jadinii]|uniref:Uncharacterized protein n=1 Tax=Cyberlindnera jadinii (strain ATCC 18201 / CBS 1600 / BCRC 20928 / JCM 3617 / NBRC 0987 / NRRL Y-1542) TaxID=983966 RepID=A0A0H5CDL7_CYBJN|nr:hypothetical protein CYBJADRAFT_160973 [Cyberlindnera jadinii NRRL Y-1542]ODV75564.1 hypothetical protein CYBJADRAFT_160973 [Cyberlindnera jadinii NRRL Y-1542]CEP22684.1 unnamed protein product [Cyberlindnera jadinii]